MKRPGATTAYTSMASHTMPSSTQTAALIRKPTPSQHQSAADENDAEVLNLSELHVQVLDLEAQNAALQEHAQAYTAQHAHIAQTAAEGIHALAPLLTRLNALARQEERFRRRGWIVDIEPGKEPSVKPMSLLANPQRSKAVVLTWVGVGAVIGGACALLANTTPVLAFFISLLLSVWVGSTAAFATNPGQIWGWFHRRRNRLTDPQGIDWAVPLAALTPQQLHLLADVLAGLLPVIRDEITEQLAEEAEHITAPIAQGASSSHVVSQWLARATETSATP